MRRYMGAVLFVFVFTLPLHFHPAAEISQIAQECSCYDGGRTQLGSGQAAVVLVPDHDFVVLVAHRTKVAAAIVAKSESARAPPYSV
jgi:hypothetical protein